MKEKIKPVMVLLSQVFYERNSERKELLKRFNFIVEKFHDYIDDFIEGLKKEPLQPKYRMSSLTYYRDILLESKKED